MKIAEKFRQKRPVISFEVFPPKTEAGYAPLYAAVERLGALKPDFISITCGAGGDGAGGEVTVEIASKIQNVYKVDAAAHMTGLHHSKADIDHLVSELREQNIENIMCLRGDRNPDLPLSRDFRYASDLAAYLRESGWTGGISGGCYPEVHPEAESPAKDLESLRIKVENGTEHLITQLFFENPVFYRFLDRVRGAGIQVPVEAGIMPATNLRQIEVMAERCGANIPESLSGLLSRYSGDPAAMREAGMDFAARQIRDLLDHGVDGVHIYVLNKAEIGEDLLSRL